MHNHQQKNEPNRNQYKVKRSYKMILEATFNKLGLHYGLMELGEVNNSDNITARQFDQLRVALLTAGLEGMNDKKAQLIEKIKNVIVDLVHYSDQLSKIKHSDYISQKLGYDYTYLATLFSETTSITIEHYIIAHKIEWVKVLLLGDEINLTQIAYKLNYSSVAHLSNQFKKITGLTPTFFKQVNRQKKHSYEHM